MWCKSREGWERDHLGLFPISMLPTPRHSIHLHSKEGRKLPLHVTSVDGSEVHLTPQRELMKSCRQTKKWRGNIHLRLLLSWLDSTPLLLVSLSLSILICSSTSSHFSTGKRKKNEQNSNKSLPEEVITWWRRWASSSLHRDHRLFSNSTLVEEMKRQGIISHFSSFSCQLYCSHQHLFLSPEGLMLIKIMEMDY